MSVSTPVNIDVLEKELYRHPDSAFKIFLINGLRYGFHTGLKTLPSKSIICKNLKSASTNPICVSELLETEVSKGYLIGPLNDIPFSKYHINPIGLAEHTYNEEVSLTTTTGRSRTNTLPEAIPVNDELIQQVEELWEACLCQSTKQAYMTGVKCFQNFMCDPFRQGVNITIFENNVFHPVTTLRKYIKFRTDLGAKPQSPLFVNDDYDHTPLSRDRFISLLRDLLFRLGYKDDKFCGHSFRIGAATSAAAAGIEDHIIQTLGRWSSDCYMRYIRTNPKTIHAAQDKMCF
ncbi:unnamed protein product [Mytilus coruscus]|uniref:Tyr recombinase domain-containing protein n=1 Tax=Mytilus coruscus TaxID=42192 RepID=A0A6J8D8Z2_MYTCO|nr:unnamed protein product [Mytilus coruscus]